MPDLETDCLRSIDSSVFLPWNAAGLPGELLTIIIQYLRSSIWETSFRASLLRSCSLTCRDWAAYIRPVLLSTVTLRSRKKALAFSALVRSPAVMTPGLLRDAVHTIRLQINKNSRPWMYHVWVLLRGSILPNLKRIDFEIKGQDIFNESELGRSICEVLLDIGLPRILPSMHPIRLHTLTLRNQTFRVYS